MSNKCKWYVPHHPIINSKKLDKVHIVYDCAVVVGSKSLNDFFNEGAGFHRLWWVCYYDFVKGKQQ